MRLSEMKTPGKYLKKENLAHDKDTIVTIAHGGKEQVGQGANKEEKYVLYFKEMQTGLIVNNTNADAIARAHPVDDDEELVGKPLALYVDPTVTFGSNTVGGIRVRPEAPPAVGTYDLGDVPAPV